MSEKISVIRAMAYDLRKYVNTQTGEYMKDELGDNARITYTKTTDRSLLMYDNFSILDNDSLYVLYGKINNSDFSKVVLMAGLIKTPMSILYNHSVPQTNETLQKYLCIKSKSLYMKMINRLIDVGVLMRGKVGVRGSIRISYMINPYLFRKGKVFENVVLELFSKFE